YYTLAFLSILSVPRRCGDAANRGCFPVAQGPDRAKLLRVRSVKCTGDRARGGGREAVRRLRIGRCRRSAAEFVCAGGDAGAQRDVVPREIPHSGVRRTRSVVVRLHLCESSGKLARGKVHRERGVTRNADRGNLISYWGKFAALCGAGEHGSPGGGDRACGGFVAKRVEGVALGSTGVPRLNAV